MNKGKNRPIILVFVSFYLPGYRGGGPIRSIANMVDRLKNVFDFRVVTADRDFGDNRPYDSVKVNDWNHVGGAQIYYIGSDSLSFNGVAQLIRDTPHDLLYLNSAFHKWFTIVPLLLRRLSLIPLRPIVLAPRGEFSEGALAFRKLKKKTFIFLMRKLGVYKDVIWHASTDFELRDIKSALGCVGTYIHVARNLAAQSGSESFSSCDGDSSNAGVISRQLRICFLSRVSPKKNLDYAINILLRVEIPILFHIYGPIEDAGYWEGCKTLIGTLPSNVSVSYCGAVENSLVCSVIEQYDVFFLPTHGENYGHVFIESFSAGVPVLISDQTPWRSLREKRLGWDISLDDPAAFVDAINEAYNYNEDDWCRVREHCRSFAREKIEDVEQLNINAQLFHKAIQFNSKWHHGERQ